MAVIPDVSGRVRRLRVYERELNHQLAFNETFSKSHDRHQALRRFIELGEDIGGESGEMEGGGGGAGGIIEPLGFGSGGDQTDGGVDENVPLEDQSYL